MASALRQVLVSRNDGCNQCRRDVAPWAVAKSTEKALNSLTDMVHKFIRVDLYNDCCVDPRRCPSGRMIAIPSHKPLWVPRTRPERQELPKPVRVPLTLLHFFPLIAAYLLLSDLTGSLEIRKLKLNNHLVSTLKHCKMLAQSYIEWHQIEEDMIGSLTSVAG